jgi:hypothetical protein
VERGRGQARVAGEDVLASTGRPPGEHQEIVGLKRGLFTARFGQRQRSMSRSRSQKKPPMRDLPPLGLASALVPVSVVFRYVLL